MDDKQHLPVIVPVTSPAEVREGRVVTEGVVTMDRSAFTEAELEKTFSFEVRQNGVLYRFIGVAPAVDDDAVTFRLTEAHLAFALEDGTSA